jgi:hypothetical protein
VGRSPAGLQERFVAFMASPWYLVVLAGAVLLFVVMAVTAGTAVFITLALFGIVLLALQGFLQARSTFDERSSAFTVRLDARSARELAFTILDVLDAREAPITDSDGSVSVDLPRKGAALGVHMTVSVTPDDNGTRVVATSRYRIKQPPSKLRTNEDVLKRFEAEFTKLAPKTRAT